MTTHLDVCSGLHSLTRKSESRGQEADTDGPILDLVMLTDIGQHCEACGALFASTRLEVYLRHVRLNLCRRRQMMAGRSRLGRWWVVKKLPQ